MENMGLKAAIRRKLETPIKPWENLSKSIFEPHEARRIASNIAKLPELLTRLK
jgi:hypothetical protein